MSRRLIAHRAAKPHQRSMVPEGRDQARLKRLFWHINKSIAIRLLASCTRALPVDVRRVLCHAGGPIRKIAATPPFFLGLIAPRLLVAIKKSLDIQRSAVLKTQIRKNAAFPSRVGQHCENCVHLPPRFETQQQNSKLFATFARALPVAVRRVLCHAVDGESLKPRVANPGKPSHISSSSCTRAEAV